VQSDRSAAAELVETVDFYSEKLSQTSDIGDAALVGLFMAGSPERERFK
jgi:hypothetical protein